MASYNIPKITPSVFNSNDYISDEYLTKSQADELYINELPESVERLIGNINVIGEETVTSQVVTGTCLIGGNLTSGKTGDGVSASTASTTVIRGDVTIGDQNDPTTVVRALGRVVLGWGQQVHIRGSSVNINANADNGTTATFIGNGSNSLNVNTGLCTIAGNTGATGCNIGRASSSYTTNLLGNVNISQTGSGNTTIGNGSNTLTVNDGQCLINTNAGATGCTIGRNSTAHTTNLLGNVSIGQAGFGTSTTLNGNVTCTNNLTVNGNAILGGGTNPIILRGSSVAINDTTTSGNLLAGCTGLAPNAGQKNTLLGSQNLIYNPRLCDNTGNVILQNFNLNNPSHFVFNQNLKYENSTYSYCETTSLKNCVFFLNTPSLVANQCYTVFFDFHYYAITGRGQSGGASVAPNASALTLLYTNSTSSISRALHSNFALVITKSSGANGDYAFTYINANQTANPFVPWVFPGSPTGVNTTPLGFSKATSSGVGIDGKIRVNIQFPRMTNTTYTTANDFMISMGASLRVCNSNVTSANSVGAVLPNNSLSDSTGGTCYFSLD